MSDKNCIPTASMSGPELYAMRACGYIPLGVVVGVAAMSMGSRGFGRSIRAIFQKGEMSAITQTSSEARLTALARAQEAAAALGGDLVVVGEWDVRDVAEIVEVTCTCTVFKKTGEFVPMPMATATN